ncbi:hypothetical protein NDA10_007231 [Ustilago hordei]|nr:hypothetical protein NDA10_007231 [Ustilago hordei]KAJ1586128.1 hypothetical protein NDA12_005153 [Ustilago hordei]UTT93166.1 hypothetical protein NDA17_003967 [Ustilago hordei]
MDDIDAAFDDAYRTNRIEAGDDPNSLPNPYSRPSLTDSVPTKHSAELHGGGGGGFIIDGNDSGSGGDGFIIDDQVTSGGGGGFIIDDDQNSIAGGGGFLPDDNNDKDDELSSSSIRIATKVKTIPLSAIPEALANLGLDSSDLSVLSLFAETAYVPSTASRRRLPAGVRPEKVVGRQEFQQVASVLLDEMKSRAPHPASEREEEEEGGRRRPTRRAAVQGRKKAARFIGEDDAEGWDEGGGGFMVGDAADDSEDDFAVARQRRRRAGRKAANLDTGSDLTDEDSEGEFDTDAATPNSSRRRRGRVAASPFPSPSPSPSDDGSERTTKRQRRQKPSSDGRTMRSTNHLNPLQREKAAALFQLLLDRLPPSTLPLSQRRVGTEQLAQIVKDIREKIAQKEIEEMVEEGAKLFAPASEDGERKSGQAIRGAAAAQGIVGGSSVGIDEFAGILVHNRLI